MRLRVDGNLVESSNHLPGQRIEPRRLVRPRRRRDRYATHALRRRHDLDDVAADAGRATTELGVVSFVLDLDELAKNLVAIDALTQFEQQQPVVRLRRTKGRCTTRWPR